MEIQVRDKTGEMIWSRGPEGGVTNKAYGADGTLHKIELELEGALQQCRGELALAVDSNRVSEIR